MLQRFFSFVCNPCGNGILLYTLFLCNTSLRTFFSFNFLQNFILFCYKNDYSFHLSHLFWCTLLFMEDTNFVINNIRILIRLNFSEVSQRRHCIADITKNCFVGFVTMFEKEKWICWKIINTCEQRITKSDNK